MVEHGVGGLLSPPGDVSAIAAATASLLNDATRRRAMGHAAAQHAARFDWAVSGDLMLGRYSAHAAPVPPRSHGSGDAARPPPPMLERLHAWWHSRNATASALGTAAARAAVARVAAARAVEAVEAMGAVAGLAGQAAGVKGEAVAL